MATPPNNSQPNNASFEEQRDILREINAELGNQANYIRESSKAYSSLENIARQFQNNEEGISKLSEKQLKNLREKTANSVKELSRNAQLLKNQKQLTDLSEAALNAQQNLTEEHKSLLRGLREGFQIENEFLAAVEAQVAAQEKINEQVGLTGKLLKGINKIPLVGEFLDAGEALESANEAAASGANKLQVMGAAAKSLGKNLLDSVTDPLTIVTGLLNVFLELDKTAGDFAKSQNMTYNDALKARESYASMAASSGDLSLNASNLMETQTAISAQLGTNAKLNEADLKTFTKLREQAGFTNEELMGIQQLSLANGKSLEQNTEEILGGAKAYAMRNKVVVNEKQVLREVSKASASLKLSLGGSTKAIAEAVVQAKKFGLTLEQTEKMSQSLLNFEDSIESELSAELLTGKDLNLERARGLALNGKTAEAAAEIAAQVGSSAEFGKMNVIQQEAIAKAIGMERNELAQSLIDKEALAKIGFKDAEAAKAKYEELRKTMTAEEAAAELGDAELAKQYEQQSNAEKFAQTMEHVKEIFVSIVDGPMGAILNGLGEMLKSTKVIYTITGLLAGIYAGKMVGGIVQTIAKIMAMTAANTANAAAATAGATAVSFGAILPVILGGVGAVVGLIAALTADDLMSAPPGYGKRTLIGPEGAIQLNDKDTVIAGTNLFGNDVSSQPGKPTQMGGKGEIKLGGDSSSVVNAINELRRDVNALANRPINVSIDGKKVIEATTGNQPNTVGDESRKNSYQIS
jgi:hypothetical protein